jgi:hypothetical protein
MYLGGARHDDLARHAYDEAIALLRTLPLGDDARFSKRLVIALQNRALVLVAHDPSARMDAAHALTEAIAVLNEAFNVEIRERDYLLAVVWLNLANVRASEATPASDIAAQNAARRTIALVGSREDVHDATDFAEEGVSTVRHWERLGVTRFRYLASDLFRFGARVYRRYQPIS